MTFSLPKSMITISSTPQCTAILPPGFDCAITLDSSDSNYYKISTSQTFCKASNALYCEIGVQLKFSLSGSMVSNPASMTVSGSEYVSMEVKYTGGQ